MKKMSRIAQTVQLSPIPSMNKQLDGVFQSLVRAGKLALTKRPVYELEDPKQIAEIDNADVAMW